MSCRAGKELFAIYINGDIFTCHTLFGSKPLANIKDGRDLIEIFTDKENSFNDLKLDDSCKVCSIGDICNGDCPLYNTQKRKKYFCKIAKEFMLSLIENKIEVCKEMLYA
jgi:radical SAM protein with 4Fe4S-binding SPASM domain